MGRRARSCGSCGRWACAMPSPSPSIARLCFIAYACTNVQTVRVRVICTGHSVLSVSGSVSVCTLLDRAAPSGQWLHPWMWLLTRGHQFVVPSACSLLQVCFPQAVGRGCGRWYCDTVIKIYLAHQTNTHRCEWDDFASQKFIKHKPR